MPSLDSLKSQRATLAGRLAANMASRDHLRQAEQAEALVLSEIGALGSHEAAMMREWAVAGAEGDAPKLDTQERERLAIKLAQAQAQAEACRGAGVDLDATHRETSDTLRSVNAEIDRIALDALQAEHRQVVADLQAFIADSVQPRLAYALALRSMITDIAQEHQRNGRGDLAMALFQRGEATGNAVPALDFEPKVTDVLAAASAWRGRLAELTGDTPSNVVKLGSAA